jgi:dicarboxylate transporter 10
MGAACISHPLDLLKVRLQTSTTTAAAGGPKEGILHLVGTSIRRDGFLSLYNGLSASLLRQGTYSTVRFGVYETIKGK